MRSDARRFRAELTTDSWVVAVSSSEELGRRQSDVRQGESRATRHGLDYLAVRPFAYQYMSVLDDDHGHHNHPQANDDVYYFLRHRETQAIIHAAVFCQRSSRWQSMVLNRYPKIIYT